METMKVVKKIVVTMILMVILSPGIVNAQQQGDWALGASMIYGHEDLIENFGIGVKGQYNVSNPVRLEANYMDFFKKNYVKIWSFSLNIHYLFHVTENSTLYPIAGIGYLEAENTYYSKSKYGSDYALYLGGGFDYKLAPSLVGNIELKYEGAEEWNRLLLSAGITYRF